VVGGAKVVTPAHALRFVFLCYVVGVVVRRVLTARVTLDTVAGGHAMTCSTRNPFAVGK
jgi:hypothetical protein